MLYLTLTEGTKSSQTVVTELTIHMDGGQAIDVSIGKSNCLVLEVPAVKGDTAPARLCVHPGASNVVALEVIEGAGDL